MPTIEAFKAEMKKGFARPNLFKVEISKITPSKQRLYQMSCFQAQIPGHNIATTDKDIGFRSIAYQKIFSDVILGFYVDSDLSQLKFWQEWIDQIVNKNTNQHAYYDTYAKNNTIKITQENRKGHPVATWTLHDAYPKQIDPIQLDYGTNDAVMTCNSTITYRHFTVKYHEVVKIDKETPNEKEVLHMSHITRSDMNKADVPLATMLKKTTDYSRIGEEQFMEGHGNWNEWSRADQIAALRAAGFDPGHGDSMKGGALHMVTATE